MFPSSSVFLKCWLNPFKTSGIVLWCIFVLYLLWTIEFCFRCMFIFFHAYTVVYARPAGRSCCHYMSDCRWTNPVLSVRQKDTCAYRAVNQGGSCILIVFTWSVAAIYKVLANIKDNKHTRTVCWRSRELCWLWGYGDLSNPSLCIGLALIWYSINVDSVNVKSINILPGEASL